MKNLFIDSNIWLSLYHFTNDDLAQFGKLKELNGKDIQLFIPQQVYDEVYRNREAKLKDALRSFELNDIKFPVFCKEYEEYDGFSKDYIGLKKSFKLWKDKINDDIHNENLPADEIINDFFKNTKLIECESIVEKAYMRYKKGNPPGKDNKYGDAINWECLLNVIPNGEDLYLISADKDYYSVLSDNKINPFLKKEWQDKKKSKIFFYNNLVSFLSEHVKEIKLITENEKEELINKLNNSCSFEETHGIISRLNRYSDWTETQIEGICNAVEENSQVKWIIDDPDIFNFYCNILSQVRYEELNECATKRIIDKMYNDTIQKLGEAIADYKAENAEALEEYYKH
mgnify:CR=1 FL=1